jgi:hypothetical protein
MQDGRISLPHRLLTFMQSAAYQKVGINIASSFQRLWNDCTENCHFLPFLGQSDLEHMAKTRTGTHQPVIGIEGLCASILRKHVSRNPAISISRAWDQFYLPSSHIDHVVMEMYVIWSLYSVLSTFNNPKEVSKMTPGGTPVKMLAPDGRIITEGIVALDQPTVFKGVNVSATRVVMTVEKVHVPAYLINPTLLLNRQPTPLSAFGSVPFNLLCQANHLQTSSNVTVNVGSHGSEFNELRLGSKSSSSHINPAILTSPAGLPGILEEPFSEANLNEPSPMDIWTEHSGFQLLVGVEDELEVVTDPDDPITQNIADSLIDPAASSAMSQLLLDFRDYNPECADIVRTRVIGDIWHVFHQFPISLQHGLRRPFSKALSRAFFIPNLDDRRAVDHVLRQKNTTYEAKLRSNPDYIRKRVRYRVPPPEKLLSRIATVLKTFGPLCDAQTKQPLFNEKAWVVAKNVLEHVRDGDYSDPPDVSMYFEAGKDKNGLTLYRCCRGTNDVEGGVHQNLIRRFTSFNVSPRRAVNMILDYVSAHNMQVST